MDRRAFFSLGRRGRLGTLELSCERLFVRWVDATARATRVGSELDPATDAGEPPTRISTETREDLLAELDRHLSRADILRITGAEWLQHGDLRQSIDARVEAFRSTGRRVERAPSVAHHRAGA
jgi:hypothetical protein